MDTVKRYFCYGIADPHPAYNIPQGDYVPAPDYDRDIALACKGHRETKAKLETVTTERDLWMAVAKAYQDDDEPTAVAAAEAVLFEWIRKRDKLNGKGG